jgi:hypothetical protein
MTQSFRNIVAGVVAAALLAVVTVAGSASAGITGCCFGPTCSNQDASTCKASGGTPLDSTCKNANDARCGSCTSIPEAAPRGLCNAYCDRLNCPAGHPGQACDQLRRNWTRATNLTAFPCDVPDRPVCCQCPGAGPTCSSARRCLKAQCQIIDRCINGECPKPQCCECSNQDPSVCRDSIIPGLCKLKGCTPETDAVCTERGRCEQCPCGTECRDADDNVGRCVNVPGATDCVCKAPPPCGLNAAGQCGGECDDSTDKCMVVTDAAGDKKCECVPPPQPCDESDPDTCNGLCTAAGTLCLPDPNGGPCRCQPPPPPPCNERAQCGGDCAADGGLDGTCMQVGTATAPFCRCVPKCGTRPHCEGPCVENGVTGTCSIDILVNQCRCFGGEQLCGEIDGGQCLGPCPAGQTCQKPANTVFCMCH